MKYDNYNKQRTFVSINQDDRDRCKWYSSFNVNFHESADNASTTKNGYAQWLWDFKNFNEKALEAFLEGVKLKSFSRKSDGSNENHEFL